MPAPRAAPAALALVAILLAACSIGSHTHSKAWYRGYETGKDAMLHHHFKPGATGYDRAAFCAVTAYHDIQSVKSDLVQWTEGFDNGCGHP